MSQRLLEDNQRRLSAAPDADARARLLQDRAVLLARLGRVDEAHAALEDAQQHIAPKNGTTGLRSEYARAIATYFSKQFDEAPRQMQRVLARARGLAEPAPALVAECESALALFLQREGDVRGAARHARAVLASGEAPLEARYRASLALASLHQDARDHEAAAQLFHETEQVVRALDDDIAMASWLQRAAVSRVAHLRQAAAHGAVDPAALTREAEAIQSTICFVDQLPEGPGTAIDHLLLAEVRLLQNRHADALALYDRFLPGVEGRGFLHEVTAAMSDRAACLLTLGQLDDGYGAALAALRRLDLATPADIRAIVHDNMARALMALGHRAESEQHKVLSTMAWEAYAHEQREARRLLHESPSETLH